MAQAAPSCSYRQPAWSRGVQPVQARPAAPRWRVFAENRPGSSGGGGSSSSEPGPRRRVLSRKKARQPGLFEVEDVSPPRQSLGIHALPPNTHNGDQIEVEGGSYVVQSVVLQYKLVRGRYRREHARLEVAGTGRWFSQQWLETLYTLDGPGGGTEKPEEG